MITIVSANCNKRLGNRTVMRAFSMWLQKSKCDLLLTQESHAHSRSDPIVIPGFRRMAGGSVTSTWAEEFLSVRETKVVFPWWIVTRLDSVYCHNIYLSPYSSSEREAQLSLIEGFCSRAGDAYHLFMGDFNLAPNSNDGLIGNSRSTWTSKRERTALTNLIRSLDLVDMTSPTQLGEQQYSIERKRAGKAIRFRCDLALVSRPLRHLTKVAYDHSVRSGGMSFTDHSAIILGMRLPRAESDLFGIDTELANAMGIDTPVASFKTAINRRKPSSIAVALHRSGFFKAKDIGSILDYGCGRGRDVEFYQALGLQASGYDPHIPFGFAEKPRSTYDMVCIVFVLNVTWDPFLRLQIVRQAVKYLRKGGYVLIATRSAEAINREAHEKQWTEFGDGYWSHKGKRTFQKGISLDELSDILSYLHLRKVENQMSLGRDVTTVIAKKLG